MILKRGSKGAAVRSLRRKINRILGYPYLKNSQVFDVETANQLAIAQMRLGSLAPDGVFGPKTKTSMDDYFNSLANQVFIDPIHEHPNLTDLRDSTRPRLASGFHFVPNLIGVTIHQTGCQLGDRPKRLKRVNAHFLATKSGGAYLLNDLITFIWHAQGLSYFTLGLEIEGNYEGIIGKPSTLWRPHTQGGPDYVGDDILEGVRFACDTIFEYLTDLFFDNFVTWERVHAHCQSHSSRINDPGESIWTNVGTPWMRRLCLPEGDGNQKDINGLISEFTLGTGRPIPLKWQEENV